MTDAPTPGPTPHSVRRVGSPAAGALADLAAIFEDLQTVLMCCERLIEHVGAGPSAADGAGRDGTGGDEAGAPPAGDGSGPDPLAVEALWTTALLSYTRCFAPGGRGMGLTEDDIGETGLQGEVLAWHRMVRTMKKHYTDPAVNPRESFTVGVSVADGVPNGVAISSTRQALPDEQTVRQTGALAYALTQVVDKRISEHQATVLEGAASLSADELATLDEVELVEEE